MRVIAVDWSGAKAGSGARTKLWHAEALGGRLVEIRGWRSRDEVVSYLIDVGRRGPELAVGLDFAFSAPQWFLDSRGLMSVTDLWELASREAEGWLTACEPPFWGRRRGRRPEMPSPYRVADRLSVAGISPKSVFQIGGPGQVGTGSLRGWPQLRVLRNAGFAVWPFDGASMPLLVEIYPRLMTGPVRKSSAEARLAYLGAKCPSLTPGQIAIAASCEDAFDATVSALVMARHQDEFARLPRVDDRTSLLEGLIWSPNEEGNLGVDVSLMQLRKASLEIPDGLEGLLRERAETNAASDAEVAFLAGKISADDFVRYLVDISEGRSLPEGWVPQTTFWLLDNKRALVGVGHLRHWLTPALTARGGHIDYYVKASQRGKGYGSSILRQILLAAGKRGIRRALLTAASDNGASLKVIERNGGVLEDEPLDEVAGELFRRYWIKVPR